jgi:hypothetical protein
VSLFFVGEQVDKEQKSAEEKGPRRPTADPTSRNLDETNINTLIKHNYDVMNEAQLSIG